MQRSNSSEVRVGRVQQAKQLADDVRERVKALGFDRHKLVVMVRSYTLWMIHLQLLLC